LSEALLASIDRAGDHAVVVGVLALVAILGGLVYWLVLLVGRRRAGGTRSGDGSQSARGPEA
jgi:hypothetical protein